MFLLSTIINILQEDIVVVHLADGSHKNGGWADCWLILTLKPNFCSQDLFVFFFSFRKSWARSLFLLYNSGKTFKNPFFQKFWHKFPLFFVVFHLIHLCFGILWQGFLPSEIPMPSPNTISPSGLKSTSQFYPYEGSNPRRRPPQDLIGKTVKDHF